MQVRIIGRYGLATSAGDVYPGDVCELPDPEARRLLQRGRAVVAENAGRVIQTADPVVEHRDPSPLVATAPRRRK